MDPLNLFRITWKNEPKEFGGLFGSGPVMSVNKFSPAKFISRGGHIPAPLQSLRSAADMAGLELKYTELKDFKESPSEVLNYTEELVARLEKMVNDNVSLC